MGNCCPSQPVLDVWYLDTASLMAPSSDVYTYVCVYNAHICSSVTYRTQVGPALSVAEIGGVSLPIALGLWIMMLPVLTKVQYGLLGVLLRDVKVAKQFGVSAALNWLLGPALMTGLAWACLPDLPG